MSLESNSGPPSYVVTGGTGGIGRAIVDHLSRFAHVVVIDTTFDRAGWGPDVGFVAGDAGDPDVAGRAAEEAEKRGPMVGWVNNAAVFSDLDLASASAEAVLEAITANLRLAVTGSHTAVNHFLAQRRGGSIVNVSSHQGQRPVRGALAYATAKAAIDGLTRAIAVDHGPQGIRANAVALGTITTARYEQYRQSHPGVDEQIATLQPLGRVGLPAEVAEVVHFLLSTTSSFITGAVIPVDGGRSAQGQDPEAT
jgi:NAD(P)-dependent dehydrogenase (short-subunit alcohol dehydrogenase family)